MPKTTLPAPSRRTVLLGLAAGGVAAGGALTVPGMREVANDRPGAPRFTGQRKPLPDASFEQWQSEVGSIFYIATEAGALAITLIEVDAVPVVGSRPAFLRTQPFELRFDAERGARLPAGDKLYSMRHAKYDDFGLYFGTVGEAFIANFN